MFNVIAAIIISKTSIQAHVHVQSMIRYSHAMTCLMAYHSEKRTEAISIMLQAIVAAMLAFVIMIHKPMKEVDHLEEGAAAK
jgi:hypothetical protein